MRLAPLYGVCDVCGLFFGDVLLPIEPPTSCADCGTGRFWVYAEREKALQHSRDIVAALLDDVEQGLSEL